MNNEIKEILDTKLYFDLEEDDYIKIKNYITNLQQDNEMYAQLKDEYEEEIKDLQQIEQEHKKLNGELREQIKILEENNQNMQEEMARVWQENSNLKTSLDEAQEVLSEYKEENQNLLEEIHRITISSYEQGKQDYKEFNEDYKSRCEKASEYMQDFIFEPLLVQEDRKLIMFNENLRNFENILQNGSDEK